MNIATVQTVDAKYKWIAEWMSCWGSLIQLTDPLFLKDRRGDQRGGVNGSQSKFHTEFGLCPKNQPKKGIDNWTHD
jgi:hypothetical protein